MKLPIPKFFEKKEKTEYFLALLLREEKVNATIFEEISSKVKVVGEHEGFFKTTLDTASEDELLDTLDKAISSAESSLPSSIETQKTIFGVRRDWVVENKIKKQYLALLKKASDALGLIPIGFLVVSEALINLLEREEGAPVSAILVEIGEKNIIVSLIRAGKIIETKEATIEDSVVKTTDKILHHFTKAEVLPARIILFDGDSSEELSQEFIAHSWSKSLPFLHVPKTSTLPNGFDAKAVLVGAATQMGFEILEKIPHEALSKEIPHMEEVIPIDAKQEIADPKEPPLSTADIPVTNFGFLENADILETEQKQDQELHTSEKEEPEPEFVTPDIHEVDPEEVSSEKPASSAQKYSEIAIASGISIFQKVKTTFTSIFSAVTPKKLIPSFPTTGKKIVFIPPLIIAFIVAILLLYVFALKATIAVGVDPKVIENDQEMVFSTTSPTDVSKHIIASEFVSSSSDGSVSTPATGKKEVGDKAKGAITIYNSNLSEGKNLPKGTIITAPNGLGFLFDTGVSVASASGDASSIVSSTAKVAVTAKDIGKESNLPSGTKFTIDGFSQSTIIAKNDSAFSGGSKKEITVISLNDINKLLEELPNNSEGNARDLLQKQIGNDKELLPDFISSTISKKEFDKTAGQEAASVTLKGTILYQALAYKKSDIQDLIRQIAQNTDTNVVIAKEKTSYSVVKIIDKNEKEVTTNIHIKTSLLPKIDSAKISNDLAGKTFSQAEDILRKLPFVATVSIKLSPPLPLLPQLLPRIGTHITVEVKER